jgi:hypothetical protein
MARKLRMPTMLLKAPVLLAVATLGLACSARYEVGSMEPDGAGGADENTGGTMSVAGSVSAGGSGNAGPGVLSEMCIRRVTPEPVMGDLVAPTVVWGRVSKLIWGTEEHAPPAELPETTSYAFAGHLVEGAFLQAQMEVGAVPGIGDLIRQWLSLGPEPLEGGYEMQLVGSDNLLLDVLLRSSWEPGRAGVFSEPTWLALNQSIPARGAKISTFVFGKNIPAPPPNVNRNIYDDALTERQAMERAIVNAPCAACHNLMNPLGYALGHFDHDGNYRELDHGQSIDTTGSYLTNDGDSLEFDGIEEFGAKASDSCDANRAIVDNFLRVALSEPNVSIEARELLIEQNQERVRSAYVMGGRSYLALVKAYAQSPLVLK